MNSVVYQIEDDFGIEHLVRAERGVADEPGPGEILLRMKAASINYRDLLMVEGKYDPRQPLPVIPCSDGVGEVVAVGRGVNRVSTGDRVCTCFARGWLEGPIPSDFKRRTLGGPLDGVLAHFRLEKEEDVVAAPEFMSDEEAATLTCAALTAWSAVCEQGQIGPGDSIVVQGTGGVALFALRFAVELGATVILTSKSDEKLARAEAMGAAHVINYRSKPEWSRLVKELTGGIGADHVVELGGSATLRQSIRAVKSGGFVSMIGILGGPVAELDLPLVVMRNVRLQGVTVGPRTAFERMNLFMSRREIRPVVDRVFALEDIGEAFAYLKSAQHFGKVCIRL